MKGTLVSTLPTQLVEAGNLRKEIHDLNHKLGVAKHKLEAIESRCDHEWGESKRYSERIEDMEANLRWERTCILCGKTQKTGRYKTEKVEIPVYYEHL